MSLESGSILILDDEFDIINPIKHSLNKIRLHVYAFTDPLLALEHFRINYKDYILIVSDIRMPGMNGFEFVRKVREISPTIKILLMSAFEINSTELSVGLGETKIEGFIQKPISLREMNIVIQKHINGLKNYKQSRS
jgi:two-component SAPR family response regulator